MTQVVVIDYGMGNLHSVSKAIQAVSSSESIVISSNTDVIKAADKIVFPWCRSHQGLYGCLFCRFKRDCLRRDS